ncbi:MAG: 30S ribosomal protein S4 [Verrucomicrobia bacterium CG_4_10_14_3_um_filter_43_23]|nr:MAG: 30S ribosomal protein S4 [Verrucomicrobia bacterium CG1_02_43_26]PIP59593.1 MAG: 30S ribosomal protein S4 [Verrucomicrobia bacterium CG22_combo_CG10-13_8_21_14_all_43_17]PIX58892.1 MAG: 30S ribosomal protein S4 [Verrucomicrobia bacterium CG_4_10_14_3_um_filter_43_23]PIY61668.1 MAG: 30S ribosomal protein S4 [Verrucomicrobia bacterium CG_4_10_14_0_8_um_filter_43_34]PJA44552.1 MAG: 30S ribosomal protein S4 [Verrucomicrobia bacterium CG_4_9_14_3_um_filter_43_20]
MSRYTGPTQRENRKYLEDGIEIFPKKTACERKPYAPGQHGQKKRKKQTPFAIGLREKQKARMFYGLTEKQFRLTFERAKKIRGVTGEVFLQLLEQRLDNVVYMLGLARTRRAARQFVVHGHVLVNGKKVDIPSYTIAPADTIEVRKDKTSSMQIATRSLEGIEYRGVPAWLAVDVNALKGVVNRTPVRDEICSLINEQLIVEFYSR